MNKKVRATVYYLASAALYGIAAIKMLSTSFSTGVIWLCLGSAFLCLGADIQKKNKKTDNDADRKQSSDTTFTEQEQADIQKQNDDITVIDTTMLH